MHPSWVFIPALGELYVPSRDIREYEPICDRVAESEWLSLEPEIVSNIAKRLGRKDVGSIRLTCKTWLDGVSLGIEKLTIVSLWCCYLLTPPLLLLIFILAQTMLPKWLHVNQYLVTTAWGRYWAIMALTNYADPESLQGAVKDAFKIIPSCSTLRPIWLCLADWLWARWTEGQRPPAPYNLTNSKLHGTHILRRRIISSFLPILCLRRLKMWAEIGWDESRFPLCV